MVDRAARLRGRRTAGLGVGKVRGIGLLVVLGFLVMLTVAAAARSPRLRRLEEEITDAVQAPRPAADAGELRATS